jgi:hypothetical protein
VVALQKGAEKLMALKRRSRRKGRSKALKALSAGKVLEALKRWRSGWWWWRSDGARGVVLMALMVADGVIGALCWRSVSSDGALMGSDGASWGAPMAL